MRLGRFLFEDFPGEKAFFLCPAAFFLQKGDNACDIINLDACMNRWLFSIDNVIKNLQLV